MKIAIKFYCTYFCKKTRKKIIKINTEKEEKRNNYLSKALKNFMFIIVSLYRIEKKKNSKNPNKIKN